MKTLFIINPTAGNGKALKKWRQFKETIHFPYEMKLTKHHGHATEMVKALHFLSESVLIVGFGGDGTLREIIVGAAGADHLIVGSVAAGSGNDFGRGFYSFLDAKAIAVFLEGPKWLSEDLGEFTNDGRWQFVSSSGIGFDAEISVLVNRSPAKKWLNKIGAGKIVYLLYVIKTLARFEQFQLTVETANEQRTFENVWFATVSNQPYFGGGMKISPNSKTDDGLMELTLVHNLRRLKLLFIFGTVFTGTHTRFKEVVQMSGPEFKLTSDRAVYRHVDGDGAGKTPMNEAAIYSVSNNHWKSAIIEKKEDAK
ncbi:diacylglycerol/lipid kinase family protein [Planococcus sp. YIM B11945]|uniref:diacylglycerol/lipid kinase family protein n=1 Tax=Planococcus sp. YIM B11945 TaxID=3435410 RepID=UPI003D7C439B